MSTTLKKPIIQGVYFLVKGNQIVYVGSCKDVYHRVSTHQSNIRLKFNSWTYQAIDDYDKMVIDEIKYIKKLTPRYNIKDNPKAKKEMQKAINLEGIEKKRISWHEVERIFKKHKINPIYRNVSQREILVKTPHISIEAKEMRTLKGLTIKKLSNLCRVSVDEINKIESGKDDFKFESLIKVFDYMKYCIEINTMFKKTKFNDYFNS
jgi:predicted GIY-YIG superfamily endonuclease